ncbi:chorismate-binding protein [Tenacibaculum caenipelagi]|uniref:isochorismate synthase n=1 Tax=Tenacibaculum caenipelagi TaxID=1325435 RepID=A0A4R6TDI4_9FLAO|nr:chorismate-binding protein [Tenacibaculum caenipelagi]TDQ27935.1 isochorismate synthase [Tenacibaculum caenipelagi]
MNIFLKIEETLQKQLPFVAYRKPNTSVLKGRFQKNNNLITSINYSESGFIFAPFDSSEKAIIIPEEQSDFYQEEITLNNNFIDDATYTADSSSEENHIQLVKKGVKAIKNKLFKKVVLSRKEKVEVSNFNLIQTFQKLLYNYPTAFVYVWYHPKVGLWLGATPEILVSIQNNQFTTMSLAGTQIYNGTTNVIWQPKEIEEQQFVTDYIIDRLSEICSEITTSETETIKAGNLLHIRTVIHGNLTTDCSTLINTLHPTPAVCGLPLMASKQFITNNENYSRNFYTGFLGELNLNTNKTISSELFVNLRCMEVENNTISIYVGGGITKDSDPTKEWEETTAKTITMKKVL